MWLINLCPAGKMDHSTIVCFRVRDGVTSDGDVISEVDGFAEKEGGGV